MVCALVDNHMPVLFVATHHKGYEKIISNMQEVKARGGRIIAIVSEDDKDVVKIADECISIPKTLAPLAPSALGHPTAVARLSYCRGEGTQRRPATQSGKERHRGVVWMHGRSVKRNVYSCPI